MTSLEKALLVTLGIVVLLLVIDSILIRRRVSALESEVKLQAKICKQLAENGEKVRAILEAHNSIMDENSAAIRRLDEQTGKIAKRLFEHTDSKVSHGQAQLAATVERVQKAQFWRNRGEGVLGVHANETADEERPAEGLSP